MNFFRFISFLFFIALSFLTKGQNAGCNNTHSCCTTIKNLGLLDFTITPTGNPGEFEFYFPYQNVDPNILNHPTCDGLLVQRWQWDFGGGNIVIADPLNNPVTHTFNVPANCNSNSVHDISLCVQVKGWINPDTAAPEIWSCSSSKTLLVPGPNTNNDFSINAIQGPCGQFQFSYTPLGVQTITDPQWSFGDGYLASGHTTGHTYNTNGMYVVVLTDGSQLNFCPIVTTVNISGIPIADFSVQTNCSNTAQFLISGYNAANNYSWNFDGNSQSGGPSKNFTFTSSGSKLVYLTVIDPSGCSSTISKVIQVGGNSASFSVVSSVCTGSYITVAGVAPGGQTYTWEIQEPGTSVFSPINNGVFPVYQLNNPGTYILKLIVQSNNGCPLAIHTEQINVFDPPAITFSESINSCSHSVILTPSLTGNITSYSIDYGDGTNNTGTSLPATFTHTYSGAGIYTINLEVTGPGGCKAAYQNTIVLGNVPLLNVHSPSTTICSGGQTTLTAVVTNPSGTPTYNWTGPQTGNGQSLTITTGGTYNVSVSFGGGCTTILNGSITITELPQPTASITATLPTNCPNVPNGSVTLSVPANLAANGYTINGGSVQNSTTVQINNLSAGSHYIKIANAQQPGCFDMIMVNIPDNSPIINLDQLDSSYCNASTGLARIDLSSGGWNFEWYNVIAPSTIISSLDIASISSEINSMPPGKYVVTATNVNTGCILIKEIEIPGVALMASLANPNPVACTSSTTQVEVVTSYNLPISATPSLSYIWYEKNISGSWMPWSASTAISQLPSGAYKIEISDATTGCIDIIEFEVLEVPDLSISLNVTPPNCPGELASVEALVSGGTGNYSYSWSPSGSDFPVLAGVNAGPVSVTVTDIAGCSETATTTVIALSQNPIVFINATITNCSLSIEVTGGVGPYHYQWYIEKDEITYSTSNVTQNVSSTTTPDWFFVHGHSGEQTTTTSAANFESGDYKVVITDANGCQLVHQIVTFLIPDPTIPDFSFVWTKVEVDDQGPGDFIDPIIRENMAEAKNDLFNAFDKCVLQQQEELTSDIASNCLSIDKVKDKFTIIYDLGEHHYTLYYYDRANQLIKTIPPQGVEPLANTEIQDVKDFRVNQSGAAHLPNHKMATKYWYNSLGQLIDQETPDGGLTKFLYDDLNRLRFSQNAQQAIDATYSYTKYDNLGRVTEVGKSILPTTFAALSNDADDMSKPATGSEITHTVYTTAALVDYYGKNQRYLQNRVSYVWSDEDGDVTTLNDRNEIYYSYDPHGNVEWVIQDDPKLGKNYLAYDYDLISGNVLEVRYNEYRLDKFFHRYSYDEENRIISVQTSRDGFLWDTDAQYEYYLHGPLRKTILGEDNVQGIDYNYTIHGWLKSINTPHLGVVDDPSQDGMSQSNLTDIPSDRFGMTLGYYEGDFTRSGHYWNTVNAPYEANNSDAKDLFNGNIAFWMNSQITENASLFGGMEVEASRSGVYNYDLLNRIIKSKNTFASTVGSINNWGTSTDQFETNYDYGANGNITKLTRKQGTGMLMDELEYEYDNGSGNAPVNNNQLTRVIDNSTFIEDGRGDLENEHNYTYDAIGNLTQDIGEERLDLNDGNGYRLFTVTLNIDWNVYGKVKSVEKNISGFGINRTDYIDFTYTPNGDRRTKIFREDKNNDGNITETEITTTFYIRDVQGNIMSIYERKNEVAGTDFEAVFSLIEQPIYGSDRLGISNRRLEIARVLYSTGDEIALDLPDELIERSEYQNWISSSNRSILNNAICTGRITTIDFDASNNNQFDSDSDLVQFIGVAGNGVAVAENLEGELQFYVVLAENYLGVQDACLVFDKQGNLMMGTNLITEAYPKAKPIIIQHPGTETYALITLNALGQPEYHTIDMGAIGFGTAADPMGEVIAQNQTIDAQTDAIYGWHFAGYENHISNRSIIYHTRYQPSIQDPLEGTTEILAYVFGSVPNTPPQIQVLHSVAGFGSTEVGELQISETGQELSWYQHDLHVSAFAHRTFKLHLLPLAADHISLLGTPLVFSGSPSGNYGEGNLEFNKLDLFYSQRGVYLENGSDKNIFNLERLTGSLLPTNNTASNYLYHEIKRGADGRFYIPRKTDPASSILTFDGSVGSEVLFPSTEIWELSSALPTQVYKVTLQPAPDTGYKREIAQKRYELKDHLGNVRVLVSDVKLGDIDASGSIVGLAANVEGRWDYYPFGMGMKERVFGGDGFRFGFNGMEIDKELRGGNNNINYKYRMNDPRIGKFLSIDPLSKGFPWNSSYAFAENDVIRSIDLEGAEKWIVTSPYMKSLIQKNFYDVIDQDDVIKKQLYTDLSKEEYKDKIQIYFGSNTGGEASGRVYKNLLEYAKNVTNPNNSLYLPGFKKELQIIKSFGLTPEQILEAEKEGVTIIGVAVGTNDESTKFTIGHELDFHLRNAINVVLGKEEDVSGEHEHILNYGTKYYDQPGKDPYYSPTHEEVLDNNNGLFSGTRAKQLYERINKASEKSKADKAKKATEKQVNSFPKGARRKPPK